MSPVTTVHIEGLDLAGKTCVCSYLKQLHPEWDLQRNSLCSDNQVFALADQLRKRDAYTSETLGYLFVAALIADLERYEPPTVTTIQDSTVLLRSACYYQVVGHAWIPGILEDLLPRHPRFTVSVVLTANEEVRLERLNERYKLQPDEVAPDDLMLRRDPKRFFAMEQCLVDLAKKHFGAIVIDNSSLTVEEVAEEITNRIAAGRGTGE